MGRTVIVEWMLPADSTAAQAAREHVALDLGERGIADAVTDDAVLVASELAANAIRHGLPPVLLRLAYAHDSLRITVSNHGSSPDPRILAADTESDHGRGLAMVEAMARQVGWERDGDRLDVWAELALDQAP